MRVCISVCVCVCVCEFLKMKTMKILNIAMIKFSHYLFQDFIV